MARWAAPLVTALTGLSLLVGLTRCGSETALLLTVVGDAGTTRFDLRVKDLDSGKVVLDRKGEPLREGLSAAGGVRVAVDFQRPGAYLVYVLGQGGSGKAFFIKRYDVDGVVEDSATLVPLAASADVDGDGYPACGTQDAHCPPMSCAYLDCNDASSSSHPFADEVCGDGKDNDCSALCGAASGAGDVACSDNDKDGVSSDKDCDDSDPCRSPNLKEDGNFCTTAKGAFPALSTACQEKLTASGSAMTAPYCGDGVDQDCDGKDASCRVDADCDGYSPPSDCNDNDKSIHPAAKETCDGKDNNCDKRVDEGCIPCDVDGDGYASPSAAGDVSCTLPKTDPDDYDAGIHPDTTKDTGGLEGGTVKAALRGFCAYDETKNSTSAVQVRARDVDHDGDGKTAKADGCPAEACDSDGDGFMITVASAGCYPSKSQEDCDDTDAAVFPGAPDKCGDNKAQNCVSDVPCASVTDADGDGYAPPADCNDNDATIHPFATEVCDRADNDCDGLVDEGNPDHKGALIPTNVKLCNDDNDGLCAPDCTPGVDENCSASGETLSGICACSAQQLTTTPDQQNRVKCTGEDLTASASPRCFGATAPATEQCDKKDHDCDGKDFVAGQSFTDKDRACGVTQGECVEGKVTGCDLTKQVSYLSLVQAVDADFNPYWVCSGTLPWPEVCNGRDDDCDGSLPSYDKDGDGDKHIYCASGCTYTETRYKLAAGLDGCADCDDKNKDINPAAKEICNNVDDNCKDGLTDDGDDECPGKGLTCCSSLKTCIDVKTSMKHCGDCNLACDTDVADKCVGGVCMCGSSKACTGGLNCVGGTCKCISGSGSLCDGCCASSTSCLKQGTSQQSATKCGLKGASCTSCDDNRDCTTDTCTAGVCASTNKATGTSCDSGKGTCVGNTCCTGCVSSGKCQTGTTLSSCGSGGAACKPCSSPQVCQSASCATGTCKLSNVTNGTTCDDKLYCTTPDTCQNGTCTGKSRVCAGDACNDGACDETADTCKLVPKSGNPTCKVGAAAGKCTGGSCCTGCIQANGYCNTSATTAACGLGGASCQSCPATTAVCKEASCVGGACAVVNVKDGTTCTDTSGSPGKCASGVCCAGCVDSSGKCVEGKDLTACGAGGVACQPCATSDPCYTPSCKTGVCLTTKNAEGAACFGVKGRCYTGKNFGSTTVSFFCCTGCWEPGWQLCSPGTGNPRCGTGGEQCTWCGKGNIHDGPGICNTATGQCDCTKGCWDTARIKCLYGTSITACGIGGGVCQTCAGTQSCVSQSCQ